MSDGEPSSIKRLTRCAARAPALSRVYEDRVEARFDFVVYGTRFAAHQIFKYTKFAENPKCCSCIRKLSLAYAAPQAELSLLKSGSTYVSKHTQARLADASLQCKHRLRLAFSGAPCLWNFYLNFMFTDG